MDIFSSTVLLRRVQPLVVGRGTKGRWEEKDAPLKSLRVRNISMKHKGESLPPKQTPQPSYDDLKELVLSFLSPQLAPRLNTQRTKSDKTPSSSPLSPLLSLDEAEVLYIFGLSSNAFDSLQTWLSENPERCLVFIDHDIEALDAFLNSPYEETFLNNPQSYLCHWDLEQKDSSLFFHLSWFFSGMKEKVIATKEYLQLFPQLFETLVQQLTLQINRLASPLQSTMNFGETFYLNYYANLSAAHKSGRGQKLFQQFSAVPAIICGSGPSLSKQIPLLQSLKNKALIIASGSSITACSQNGLTPHFSTFIDPTPRLQAHTENHLAFEIPLIYRNRCFFQCIQEHHGPLLHIPGSGRYKTSDWFDKQLYQSSLNSLQEGVSATTFSFSIAQALGCNPIIFTGVDLSYTNEQPYARGLQKYKELISTADPEQTLLSTDIHGQQIKTTASWLFESEWISQFAKSNPSLTCINATEGGIGFTDIPQKSLKEVADQFLKKQFPLSERIYLETALSMKDLPQKGKALDSMKEMQRSLIRCKEVFNQLLEQISQIAHTYFQTQVEIIPSDELFSYLEETLKREAAFQFILKPLFEYFVRTTQRKTHRIIRTAFTDPSKDFELALLEVLISKITYLREATLCNLDILELEVTSLERNGFR